MSEPSFNGHALCQALRLEGIPSRAEANIEHFVRRLWLSNGPDFTLNYLKVLKRETEGKLVDPSYRYHFRSGDVSVSWNHTSDAPRGPLSYLYKRFPEPQMRIRVIGAMIQSVVYEEASRKQLQKLTENLRYTFRSDVSIRWSDKLIIRLGKELRRELRRKSEFSYTDLTNNVLPYAHVAHATLRNKQIVAAAAKDSSFRSDPVAHRAVLELHADKLGQFYTAPRICKRRWNDIVRIVKRDDLRYPRKVSPRPFSARDYESRHPEYGWLNLSTVDTDRDTSDYLGRLDFLQKQGGKLRSVANVNRYVNWTMEPFAKALESTFYGLPGCYVRDQAAGLKWCQDRLREGKRLVSLDLSSATDTLDFRPLLRSFRKSLRSQKGLVDPLLEVYSHYFEELSQLPLWCEGLDCAVQFRTGQPLGMKGSFQVLTVMNLYAGWEACKEVGVNAASSIAVVGDDFVCVKEVADAYIRTIESLGGKTNAEKALESDKYAEFLSHLVTKDHVYITKPKYRPGSRAMFVNLEKARKRDFLGIYKLTAQEKEAVKILQEFSVDPLDYRSNLPHLRSKDLSTDDWTLSVASTALAMAAELRDSGSYDFDISELALEYLQLEDPSIAEYTESPVIRGPRPLPASVHDSVATLPTVTDVYDHRKAKHLPKVSRSEAYRSSIRTADDLSAIKTSLTTGEDRDIPISAGLSVSSGDIVALAAEVVEHGEVVDRKQAASSDAPRRSLDQVMSDTIKSAAALSRPRSRIEHERSL